MVSPAAGLFGLEEGPWFYQRYFLHKWRSSLRRKQALFPDKDWFSREELAARFRKPVTTVKTLLRRSLIALRECLGGR